MIDTQDGTEVWRESYDRELTDVATIFDLYDDIAGEVGAAHSKFCRALKVLPHTQSFAATSELELPTENFEAYSLLMVAIYKF